MKGVLCRMFVAVCVASCAALPKGLISMSVSGTPTGGRGTEVVGSEVRSGLQTDNMLDAQPPGFRVTWIEWDSGFRGTDLRIGDRIIAIDGKPYVKPATIDDLRRILPRSIGQYAEAQHWAERGARDGTEIVLTVQRRARSGVGVETANIRGKLRAERIYSVSATRRLIGPGGPDALERDQFSSTWSAWYEAKTREWAKVLDGGWTRQTINSRMALAAHLEDKARVDFLTEKYPGPFASSVKADWERVRDSLVGRAYTITDRDLAYRRLGAERASEVAAAASRARESFLAAVKRETIDAFPAIDPIHGDRSKVTGKVVVLPEAGNSAWLSEAGHNWLAVGGQGWYFVDLETAEARRMFAARYRYEKYVQPQIRETYAIVGRIKSDPKMLVRNGRAITGLEVTPLAVTIGGTMFVDLTAVKDGESKFAGEEALAVPRLPPPKDTATPRDVSETYVAAIKYGEESLWKSLYATWWAEDWKDEGVLYHAYYQRPLDEDWIRSRRLLLDKVYEVAAIYVGDPVRIMTGKEFRTHP